MNIHHPCRVCGRPTSQWCGRCNNAHYCSASHRNSDWERHRFDCRASPNTRTIATPPPSSAECTRVSAILFLTDSERPEIEEIILRPPTRPTGSPSGYCPVPALSSYFGSPPGQLVITQGLNGETLRFPLHVFYSPSALSMGSPINHPIQHITSGAAARPWAGNVVALKFSGSRRQGYTDAGMNDLPALSAYFLSYE